MRDYDDPAVEEQWCLERRAQVEDYLSSEGVKHGRIADWPAWHVAPYVAIWAIESASRPAWVGWWVICGDLPTDYISAATIKNPREAARSFAERWRGLGLVMASEDRAPDFQIGRPQDGPSLSPLLSARASMLLNWVNNDALWEHLDDSE